MAVAVRLILSVIARRLERNDHAVLAAPTELRAFDAVGEDFFEQPRMRHDRKAHLAEVARRVRERAELFEPVAAGAAPQLVDDHDAHVASACGGIDRKRSHLGNVRAERGKLRASDNPASFDCHDKARRVDFELVERPRQEVAFFLVGSDERVQLLRLGCFGGSERHTRVHRAAPTAVRAASRRASPSSASCSVMTSGGNIRTTVSAVRLTTTPRSSPAATTGAASQESSRPHIRPAPRTSLTISCFAAISPIFRSTCWPTRATCGISPRSVNSSSTTSAARQASRLPPYVVP